MGPEIADAEAAEDALQDVFVRLWGRYQVRNDREAEALLTRTVRNVSIEQIRKRKTVPLAGDLPEEDVGEYNEALFRRVEEMARVRNLQLSGAQAYLDPIRDVFLFCCFSGLRHSDANNLRKSDIKGDHIEVTTVKTADSISIELNDVTKAILEKYKDAPFNDNKALPNYTNQAMNRDVKELCRLAGINEEIRITTYKGNVRTDEIHPKWELVGTHTGRRTFIVTTLSLGIPPNVVMKWTGHSDYSSMKPYIDIVDSIKASSMTKLNGLL